MSYFFGGLGLEDQGQITILQIIHPLICCFFIFTFFQTVEPIDIFHNTGLANPHTVHCIPGGKIMISTLGDPEGNGKCKRYKMYLKLKIIGFILGLTFSLTTGLKRFSPTKYFCVDFVFDSNFIFSKIK